MYQVLEESTKLIISIKAESELIDKTLTGYLAETAHEPTAKEPTSDTPRLLDPSIAIQCPVCGGYCGIDEMGFVREGDNSGAFDVLSNGKMEHGKSGKILPASRTFVLKTFMYFAQVAKHAFVDSLVPLPKDHRCLCCRWLNACISYISPQVVSSCYLATSKTMATLGAQIVEISERYGNQAWYSAISPAYPTRYNRVPPSIYRSCTSHTLNPVYMVLASTGKRRMPSQLIQHPAFPDICT